MYIVFGALPVTFWVMWSPFYFMGMELVPFFIGLSMILGALGVYLTLYPKSKSLVFNSIICLLLLIGQLVMLYIVFVGFNMFKRIPNSTQDFMIYYGTCGPFFVALHYQAAFIYQNTFNKQLKRTP